MYHRTSESWCYRAHESKCIRNRSFDSWCCRAHEHAALVRCARAETNGSWLNFSDPWTALRVTKTATTGGKDSVAAKGGTGKANKTGNKGSTGSYTPPQSSYGTYGYDAPLDDEDTN